MSGVRGLPREGETTAALLRAELALAELGVGVHISPHGYQWLLPFPIKASALVSEPFAGWSAHELLRVRAAALRYVMAYAAHEVEISDGDGDEEICRIDDMFTDLHEGSGWCPGPYGRHEHETVLAAVGLEIATIDGLPVITAPAAVRIGTGRGEWLAGLSDEMRTYMHAAAFSYVAATLELDRFSPDDSTRIVSELGRFIVGRS